MSLKLSGTRNASTSMLSDFASLVDGKSAMRSFIPPKKDTIQCKRLGQNEAEGDQPQITLSCQFQRPPSMIYKLKDEIPTTNTNAEADDDYFDRRILLDKCLSTFKFPHAD